MTRKQLSQILMTSACLAAATATTGEDDGPRCYYLDSTKILGGFSSLDLLPVAPASRALYLRNDGLFLGNTRICQWSANGGSGTKEMFSLDMDVAAPILDPPCENPFNHEITGAGFGDWYLTLCGEAQGDHLLIDHESVRYVLPIEALAQWTEYPSGSFPIEGATGC